MPVTLETFGLDKLSLDERIALRNALDESISTEVDDAVLTAEQMAELQRRLAHARAHPGEGSPWAEVEARLLARGRRDG